MTICFEYSSKQGFGGGVYFAAVLSSVQFVFERLCESLRGFTQRVQKKQIRNASLCQNGNFLCSCRLPRLISLDNVNVTDMKCSWKFARLGTNFGTIHSFFLRRPPMAAADNTDSRARTANGPSSLQPSVRWWREGWMGGSYRYLQTLQN